MIQVAFIFFGTSLFLLYLLKSFVSGGKNIWKSRGFEIVSTQYGMIERLTQKKSQADVDEDIYYQLKNKNLSCGVFIEMRQPMVYLTDPELMKLIMVKDFNHFTDRRLMVSKNSDPILANMLFNINGAGWKEMRELLTPTFTTGKIRKMFDTFNARAFEGVKYLKSEVTNNQNGKIIDVSSIIGRITLDIIGASAFGIESNAIKDEKSPLNLMGKELQKVSYSAFIKTFIIFTIPRSVDFLGIFFLPRQATNYFLSSLRHALKRREITKEQRGDFLQIMLEAKERQMKDNESLNKGNNGDNPKLKITEDLILAQAFVYLLAGFDPIEVTVAYILYELALNQEIQEKLAKEINKCYNEEGFNYDSINQLDYLERVVAESLRKNVPPLRIERKCVIDYNVPGTDLVIPKGTLVAFPITPLHLDPQYYPNPHIFDPDRFLPEEKQKRHPYSYMPFGHGPRNCIGNRFALMESKTVVANLVRNFVIEPCARTEIPLKKVIMSGGVNKPFRSIQLNFKNRKFE